MFMQKLKDQQVLPCYPTTNDCPEEVIRLIRQCMDWDSEARPTFDQICEQLKLAPKRHIAPTKKTEPTVPATEVL